MPSVINKTSIEDLRINDPQKHLSMISKAYYPNCLCLFINCLFINLHVKTRMHSCMMRTICCSSRLPRGGCLPRGVSAVGDVFPGGVCWGGVCQGGCLPRVVSAQGSVYLGGGVCPGVSAQNDRRLWKHYFVATTLQKVINNLSELLNQLSVSVCITSTTKVREKTNNQNQWRFNAAHFHLFPCPIEHKSVK